MMNRRLNSNDHKKVSKQLDSGVKNPTEKRTVPTLECGWVHGSTEREVDSHLTPVGVERKITPVEQGLKLRPRLDGGGVKVRVRRPDVLEVVSVLDGFTVAVREKARSLVQPGVDDLVGSKGARRMGTVKYWTTSLYLSWPWHASRRTRVIPPQLCAAYTALLPKTT